MEKLSLEMYDVFLSYNRQDKVEVKKISEQLKQHGLTPWIDEEEFIPGSNWIDELERKINSVKSVAIFIGKNGLGPWQKKEIDAFLIKPAEQQCSIITVILKSCEIDPQIPMFLKSYMWVDFRQNDPDPLTQLIEGIKGVKISEVPLLNSQKEKKQEQQIQEFSTLTLYDIADLTKRFSLDEKILVILYRYFEDNMGKPKMLLKELEEVLEIDHYRVLETVIELKERQQWVDHNLTAPGSTGQVWLTPDGRSVAQNLYRSVIGVR